MMRLKRIAKTFFRNAIMVAVVFLPAFIIMSMVQVLVLAGVPTRTTPLTELSNWFYFYLIFLPPLLLSSLVYTTVLLLVPRNWSLRIRRLAAILITPLLPATVYFLNLWGGVVYLPFFIPTIIALILYGLYVRIEKDNIEGPGQLERG